MEEVIKIVELSATLTAHQQDGWLIYRGHDAEVVSSVCGTKLIKGIGGQQATGYQEAEDYKYNPKLVKAGWKIQIPNFKK